ncbi:hypothetical protein CAI21_07885 [Alkalilimnicola ehrlichii]|uniref:Protein kinase domain-containing protein n=1 Tax=Alkalilimnicola ehrlichii TaxID=351052 RepID=A0A3E0WXC7_9GAMM|nr:lipopolysaccharide kinase InaA family protein [Alkalilimnicola ehrlichii]RFA30110.1 hypothetical protein CAI21_07885 [Alkalilimnicola ehrlichii]RFA37458.1 hypothetical protein CAL65_09230 [Alkalilimnicola ehrlichii]
MKIYWHEKAGDAFKEVISKNADDPFRLASEFFKTHARSTVAKAEVAGEPVIIKRFNVVDWSSRLKRVLGPSLALRSWRNAELILNLGIKTPYPLARIEAKEGWLTPCPILVFEYAEGIAADEYFADPSIGRAAKERVALRLAQSISYLHSAGYAHRDLKGKNVLIYNEEPWIIDLDTLRRPLLKAQLIRGIHRDHAMLKNIFEAYTIR